MFQRRFGRRRTGRLDFGTGISEGCGSFLGQMYMVDRVFVLVGYCKRPTKVNAFL